MERTEDDMPKPRSWIIALSCSWINLFVFAVFRSSGVLYMALVRTFGCSHAEAAWPITLASGVASITCLPAGFLSHYLSIRTIVSAGILITSFSIAICFFTNSITFIILFLGTAQGIGIGFITGLLPVIISDYFGKKRAAACGLSYAGAGVGAFFFPIVFQYLLDSFGFRGSLLIMGALAVHAIFGALLLSPPSVYQHKQAADGGTQHEDREIRHRSALKVKKSRGSVPNLSPEGITGEAENDLSEGAAQASGVGYGLQNDISGTAIGQEPLMCHSSRRGYPAGRTREPAFPVLDSPDAVPGCALLNETCSPEKRRASWNGRRDTEKGANEGKDEETVVDCEGSDGGNSSNNRQQPPFRKQMYARMLQDAQLLKEPHFFLITLTYVSYIMGNVTLLMILPDYVVNLGQSRAQAVLLLSFFSVTDLLGRLLPGWLSYFSAPISNKSLYAFSIGSMGILFFLYPILLSSIESHNTWTVLILLTLCCGFVGGCQMILPPVLTAELLGPANTAMAFGLSNFVCGFFSFSRPFIFKRLTVQSNRYDRVFYIFGSFALISCLAWILEIGLCQIKMSRKTNSLAIK